MYQHHEQFEETIPSGTPPQSSLPYPDDSAYSSVSTSNSEPPLHPSAYEFGQKLRGDAVPREKRPTRDRLGLAILSLALVLVLISTAFFNLNPNQVLVTTIVCALLLVVVNLLYNFTIKLK